jgi:hypothetical protein
MIDKNKNTLLPTRTLTSDTIRRVDGLLTRPSSNPKIVVLDQKIALKRLRDIVETVKQSAEDFLLDADVGGSTPEMRAAALEYANLLAKAADEIKLAVRE